MYDKVFTLMSVQFWCYIDDLVQDHGISSALAMDILQSCTKSLICRPSHQTSINSGPWPILVLSACLVIYPSVWLCDRLWHYCYSRLRYCSDITSEHWTIVDILPWDITKPKVCRSTARSLYAEVNYKQIFVSYWPLCIDFFQKKCDDIFHFIWRGDL